MLSTGWVAAHSCARTRVRGRAGDTDNLHEMVEAVTVTVSVVCMRCVSILSSMVGREAGLPLFLKMSGIHTSLREIVPRAVHEGKACLYGGTLEGGLLSKLLRMDIYFIAQVMGLSLAIVCGAALVRPSLLTTAMHDVDHESFSSMVTGFLMVVIGLMLVLSVSYWEMSWRGLLTLMAWGTLLKGVAYLVAPQQLISTARMMLGKGTIITIWMVVGLGLGLYIAMKGFGY